MATVNEQVNDFQKTAVDAAVKFARLSVDSAERLIAINLEATKATLDESAKNLKAISGVKDVQELNSVRTKIAENSLEYATAYSRTVYELAANTQAEYSHLVEERVADFQKSLVDGLDKVAKTAPAGSDVAVAALKSSLAASTAAMDSVTKAFKQAASYADANFKAAANGAAKTVATASGKRK
jgi:phasin family protein